MISDAVKMGAKVVAIGAAVLLIGTFILGTPIPFLTDSALATATAYINKAYTICNHYIPWFSSLWVFCVAWLDLYLLYWSIRGAIFAYRVVCKVNEG